VLEGDIQLQGGDDTNRVGDVGAQLQKGDKTREKSIADGMYNMLPCKKVLLTFRDVEEQKEQALTEEDRYLKAIETCDDKFVVSVLEDLKRRLDKAQNSDAVMTKKYNSAIVSAEKAKRI
jgi:3-dehydroquinate dehydratase